MSVHTLLTGVRGLIAPLLAFNVVGAVSFEVLGIICFGMIIISTLMLVPDMRAFDLNQISIAPTDIPPDVTIDVASRQVRPQDRSGVVLKFPIKFSHGALLRLIDETGVAVPLGSTATLRATGVVVPVGYDGDAYVEDLSPHNQLAIEFPDGRRCIVTFDYAPVTGDIPSIGPLRCLEKKP